MAFLPSTFYYASALLHAVTIPKHTIVGINGVGPAVQAIPDRPEFAKPKQITTATWQYVNCMLVINTILNIGWARHGGPKSLEEKLVVVANAVGGLLCGLHYFKVHMYPGLPVLWGASGLTLAATFWQLS